MADRFFPNDMPAYVHEGAAPPPAADFSLLHGLLSLPYPVLAERFLREALQLKQKVVHETWEKKKQRAGAAAAAGDFTLYTGALGTAFLLFRAYLVTGDRADLATCAEIVAACDAASEGEEIVTFICGRAGVCALGAVVAKQASDEATVTHYLQGGWNLSEAVDSELIAIKISSKLPDELLYGKVGYLWACTFLNKHIGENTIPPAIMEMIVREIIKDGRKLSTKSCPLMYEWYGEKYWGAAHVLAGIMHVLLDMDLTGNDKEYVKGTLQYMIHNRFPSGSYPSTEGDNYDCLVHWCHGAPGIFLTLTKASQMFPEERFLEAAADAADVVWNRGLLKRVGNMPWHKRECIHISFTLPPNLEQGVPLP